MQTLHGRNLTSALKPTSQCDKLQRFLSLDAGRLGTGRDVLALQEALQDALGRELVERAGAVDQLAPQGLDAARAALALVDIEPARRAP
ncbi:hypothetical protein ACMHYB_25580 [Sorangium sp. So ce1128]